MYSSMHFGIIYKKSIHYVYVYIYDKIYIIFKYIAK